LAGGLAAVALTLLLADLMHDGPSQTVDPLDLVLSAILFVPFGLVFGAFVSGAVCMVSRPTQQASPSFREKFEP
jgi:hypothetical protein